MKKEDLKSAWKTLGKPDTYFNKEQINGLIMEKYRKIIRQRIDYMGMSILLSVIVLTYLIVAGLLRWSDPYFVTLNGALALYLTILSLFSIKYFRELTAPGALTEGVKQGIEKRAVVMEKGFKRSRWDLAIVYPLGILLTLSIHVFFERKPFLEVMKNEESIWGIMIGLLVGLTAATIYYKKVTKYFGRQMKEFRNMLAELD